MISTGAVGFPIVLPEDGTPFSCAWTSSTPWMLETDLSSLPETLRSTSTPTTTTAATMAPMMYPLFNALPPGIPHDDRQAVALPERR